MEKKAEYLGKLVELWSASGVFGPLFLLICAAFPYAVVGMYYPSDVLEFHASLQGMTMPQTVTLGMKTIGIVYAFLYLVALSLLQLIILVMIFHRAMFFIPLYPVSIAVAMISNAIWWLWTGYFDLFGALAAFSVMGITVMCHSICLKMGADFIFGTDNRPEYPQEY
jgi:hypothetical protein